MKFYTLLVCVSLVFIGCDGPSKNPTSEKVKELPSFTAHKATSKIVVDGKADEVDWNKSEVHTFKHFYYHDSIKKENDEQRTEFRMLWDEDYLYAFFNCSDKFITARELVRDGAPYMDDCAEVFLSPVPDQIPMHMGFEVNLFNVSNDFWFMTDYYKGQTGVLKAFNPDFETEVVIKGTVNNNSDIDEGWTMEMKIPLDLFFKLDTYAPIAVGSRWTFLALRQDRNEVDGVRRITSTLFPSDYEDGFDVHAPSSFGYLYFKE